MLRMNRSLSASFSVASLVAFGALVACGGGAPPPAKAGGDTSAASTGSTTTAAAPKVVSCVDSNEKDCMTKCDAGDMESCVRIAETIRFGSANIKPDMPRGYALLKRACDKNVGKACYWLSDQDKATKKEAVEKAKPLVLADCNRGDAASCQIYADYAMLANQEAEQKKFEVRANELYAKACNDGDYNACGMAIGPYYDKKDWAGGLPFVTKGCEHDDPESCKWLAGQYAEALGVPKDPKRARELYEKACKLGSAASCDAARALH